MITKGNDSKEGLIVKNTGSNYIVKFNDGSTVKCRIKGNFRTKGIRTTNPIAVGDKVIVTNAADDADYITDIYPRKNYIIRRASNLSKESQILASNIDQAILTATLHDPATPLVFIDRFLATAEAYSIPTVLLLNKSDLWNDDEREIGESLQTLYESIGYKVIILSSLSGEGMAKLRLILKGKISLISGNSGVGKSTIVNCLVPDAKLKTGCISDYHRTGMHTTTFSEMIPIPGGGEIIDTPGIKGFGTIDFKPDEVSHYFPEIFRCSERCRYGDCTHTYEPGCAVKEAIDKHYISESRYNSYMSILEDAQTEAGTDKYRKPF